MGDVNDVSVFSVRSNGYVNRFEMHTNTAPHPDRRVPRDRVYPVDSRLVVRTPQGSPRTRAPVCGAGGGLPSPCPRTHMGTRRRLDPAECLLMPTPLVHVRGPLLLSTPRRVSTRGGDVVAIQGTNLGKAQWLNGYTPNITAFYGPASDPRRYTGRNCMVSVPNTEVRGFVCQVLRSEPLVPHPRPVANCTCIRARALIAASCEQVKCTVAPGVGARLVWTVCVGSGPGYATPWCSDPSLHPGVAIAYDAPLVTALTLGAPASSVWGITSGGDEVLVRCRNCGSQADAVAQVMCGPLTCEGSVEALSLWFDLAGSVNP